MSMVPIPTMTTVEMDEFMSLPISSYFAEVGSRHLKHTVIFNRNPWMPEWITVQTGRYESAVSVGNSATIRFIVRDYLACEVCW